MDRKRDQIEENVEFYKTKKELFNTMSTYGDIDVFLLLPIGKKIDIFLDTHANSLKKTEQQILILLIQSSHQLSNGYFCFM